MPDHLRSVLQHYYMEDKSYRTIADEEGISISTLKMRLFRAKKMFKKLGGNF
jgi:DNA-directed RNA polymerase specialized sigma24 family protein